MFYIRFKQILLKNERIAHFLLFGERCERFGHDRSFPLGDVSESVRSLTKNEQPWVICSHPSEEMSNHERITQVAHQKWANEWIVHFWAKNELFARKTDKRIPSPGMAPLTNDHADISDVSAFVPVNTLVWRWCSHSKQHPLWNGPKA